MWAYVQSSGELYNAEGEHVATGYSGFGDAKNQPACDLLHDRGPIPAGRYTIHAPQYVDKPGPHGPYVLPLTPDIDTNTHGRSGFLVHGDSIQSAGTASHGCIILPRGVREQIWRSGDNRLKVVARLEAIPV